MRLAAHLLLTALLGLGLTGCALFKKNNNNNSSSTGSDNNNNNNNNNLPPPKFPTGDPIAPAPPTKSAAVGGGVSLLAGRVLDGNGMPPPNTSIFVVRVDGKEEQNESDVPVSAGGHFTINNLRAGGQYKLIARGKTGDRMVAGIHYATAPNPLVLIQMREENVASNIPPLPEHFGSLKDRKEPRTDQSTRNTPTPAAGGAANASWQPGNGGVSTNELTLPAVHVPSQPDGPVAQNTGPTSLPPLMIETPRPIPQAKIAPNQSPPQAPPEDLGPAKVPSAVVVGKTVVNFALTDMNGQPWEFRKDRTGKLIILDFWAPNCPPCRAMMPYLTKLQNQYGSDGLEVIGIAYDNSDSGMSPQELAHQVTGVTHSLAVSYRQLLGPRSGCPLQGQLKVDGYPALFVLDENGNIIARHSYMQLNQRDDLERLIQQRLRRSPL